MNNSILEKFEGLKAQKTVYKTERDNVRGKQNSLEESVEKYKHASEIVNSALITTQRGVKEFIEDIVTKALQIVYQDSYRFKLKFEAKRNQSEVRLIVEENGIEYDVQNDEKGGGVLDVVSFALRLAFNALDSESGTNVFILDECAKNLGNLREKFGNMMKELSEMLGLQIFIVTHSDELAQSADAIYQIKRKDNISKIERLI